MAGSWSLSLGEVRRGLAGDGLPRCWEGLAKRAPPPPTTLPCTSAPQLLLFYHHTRPLRLTNPPDLQEPPPSPPNLENGVQLRGTS